MKKLRRIMAVFLSLTLALGSMGLPEDLFKDLWEGSFIGAEAAETLTSGDYQYQILGDRTVTLIKYTGSDSVVNIPSTIDGKSVTDIYNAFYGCTNLISVTIPDSVIDMRYAFYGCTSLTSVNIPDNVIWMGYAFYGCTSLTSVTIPDGVTGMNHAFYGCTNLTSVNIPNSVTDIGCAFQNCTSLTSVNIPNSVKYMESAFFNCTSLTNVNIPDSVTSIDLAFYGCTSLTSVNIPDSVTNINSAFYGCTNLTSVNIPDSVTNINSAFYGCTNLTSVTIPDSVTNINSAFNGCTSLTSVNIPDSVTNMIGDFSGCTSLTSVTIPDSVTNMDFAFYSCTSLTSVNIPDSVTSIRYAFNGCTSLTSITIPNSVTYIGGAFSSCTNLKTVTIPDSVTVIDSHAFYDCPDLTIHCYRGSYAETYAIENNIPYKIIGVSARSLDVTLEKAAYKYTGSEIKPKVTVKDGNTTLTKDTDYTVAYKDNKSIGTGAVIVKFKGKYSGRKSVNFSITDGDLPDTPESNYSFFINIVDENGKLLNGCSATCNNKNAKVSGSHCFVQNIIKESVIIISKDGYYPKVISTKEYFERNKALVTITMYKKSSVSKYSIASAVLKTDGIYEDISKNNTVMTINENNNDDLNQDVTISCSVVNDADNNIKEYQLYCRSKNGTDKLIATSNDGTFNLKKHNFMISKYYHIKVKSKDNNYSNTEMYLSVVTTSGLDQNLHLSLGSDFEMKIGDDVPLIGGYTFKINEIKSDLKLNYKTDGTICIELGSFDIPNPKLIPGLDCQFSVSISGGGKINTNGVAYLNILATVSGKISGEGECDIIPFGIPLHLELGAQGSASATAELGYDFENKDLTTDSGISLDFGAELTPYIGLGNKWANLGLYGTAGLDIPINLVDYWSHDEGVWKEAGIQKVTLAGEIGVKCELGPFEHSFKITDGELVLYDRYAGLGSFSAARTMLQKSLTAKTEKEIYDVSNYKLSEPTASSVPANSMLNEDAVTDIISGCTAGASPKVVSCGDTTLMVYKDNSNVLKYSVYNKSTNKWSEAVNVDDNGSLDSGACLWADGDKIYLVYEESDYQMTDSSTLNDYTQTLEISSAEFNKETGRFENYSRLTDNSFMDSKPVITVSNGVPTAAWTSNTNPNYFGTNSTNKIMYSRYINNSWTEPETAAENLNCITDFNIGTAADKMYITYVIDDDNDLTTVDDRTLYAVDTEKNINLVSQGSVDNVQFTSIPEVTAPVLTWYEDADLMYVSQIGDEKNNLLDDCDYKISSDYVITGNRIFYISKNENSTDLYMISYEDGWSQPVCVNSSSENDYYEHISASGDMVLMLNSKPDFENSTDEKLSVVSSIAAYQAEDKTALSVNDISYDSEYAVPNYTVPVYINVTNTGTKTINGVSVDIYKGTEKVYSQTADYTIRAGRNENIRILLDTDDTVYTGEYKAVVTPLSGNDLDESDNTKSFGFNLADLEVSANEYFTEKGGAVSVCVSNNSYIPASNVVITASDSNGKILKTINVSSLKAHGVSVYDIPVSELLDEDVKESFVKFSVSSDADEYDTVNNSAVESISRLNESIGSCEITLSNDEFVYDGTAKKPKVTIKDGEKTLENLNDYVIRYANNVNIGTASVIISGKGRYTGTVTKTFTIKDDIKDISQCTIAIPKSSYTYTGTAIKPKVTITDGSKTLELSTDYMVRYTNNVNIGTASIVIAGRGKYTGTVTKTFAIQDETKDISKCTITIPKASYNYTGSAIKPKVTVTDGSETLELSTDYAVRYTNNVNIGTASIVIAGRGKYAGTVAKTFTIQDDTKDISQCSITIPKSSYTYTGTAIKPKVTIIEGNKTLELSTDYVVRYTNNVNAGTASIIISGRGNYSGTVEKTFAITEQ